MQTVKTTELFTESVKTAEKWLRFRGITLLDLYSKQMTLLAGFYPGFYDELLENRKKRDTNKSFSYYSV